MRVTVHREPPHQFKQLLAGLEGCRLQGNEALEVSGVAYHSGQVAPGMVFVALKGARTDGHRFVAEALARGAAAIVSEQELEVPVGVTLIRVDQARLALAHLAAAFYGHPSRELTLVGITGTNGKTSTTYLLEAILENAGHQVGVIGTVNYRSSQKTWPAPVTTPESLDLQGLLRAMRSEGVSHVCLEVSSHALDLKRVDRAAFDVGVFTNLSQDHLDYHRDMEDYFAAKSRLFLELLANGGGAPGLAVLNLDDPRGHELHRRVRVPALTYGCHPDSQVRPLSYEFRPDGIKARLTSPMGEIEIDSSLVGPFNLANILAAAATALGLGLTPVEVSRGIAALQGVPGRLERFGPPEGPGGLRGLRPYPGSHHPGPGRLAAARFRPDHHGLRLRRRPRPHQAPPDGPGRGGRLAAGGGHQRQSPHRRALGHPQGDRAGDRGRGPGQNF